MSSALFDKVRTCDNHCDFCFIYQLPPALRQSLYLKDDDYRLSFLYGNFTTLTRFTEMDLERVVTERLSPLNVSIHATDPDLRARMLRNRRGATSLRWLRALLDHGIEVHGQVVVCPGVNDGAVLDDTLCGILDEYPELATACIVPLGVSRYNTEAAMRPHTAAEARAVVDTVEDWQDVFRRSWAGAWSSPPTSTTCSPAGRSPTAEAYEGFPQHENGIGMARAFEMELHGKVRRRRRHRRAARLLRLGRRRPGRGLPGAAAPTGLISLTSPPGRAGRHPHRRVRRRGHRAARRLDRDVRVLPVPNTFFGGNIGVTGLLVGDDIARVLAAQPEGHRYLLPDVCLSGACSSTAPSPTTCPAPSRSSAPTASPYVRP